MTVRRIAPALVALAAAACTPTVPENPNTVVVSAGFDLVSSPPVLPLPNDLATAPELNPALLHPSSAQEELLALFHAQGGYPYDQTLSLTVPFVTETVKGPTDIARSAPDIDLSSIVPCTAANAPGSCNLLVLDAFAASGAEYPELAAPTYAAGDAAGTLTVNRRDGGTWRAGTTFIYALRGGSKGVKTTGGAVVNPSPITYQLLFASPSDLTGAMAPLRLIQMVYQPVFAAVSARGFPRDEIAVVGTFTIAPGNTWVKANPATGDIPFPSDFLLDPATGRITAALESRIPGISSLDGFSTTAMVMAPTSGPIQAATVRDPAQPPGVFLYELSSSGAVRVPDVVDALTASPAGSVRPAYVAMPPQIQSSGLAPLVALQPAVPVSVTGVPPMMLPPLKENTEYAVVITNRVKDAAGQALSNTTLGQIVLFTHPLYASGASQLPGVDAATAQGLEAMRLALQPVITQLGADTGCGDPPSASGCVAKADVTMAYTFRTQTISGKGATAAGGGRGGPGAVQIAAIPYTPLLAGVCQALGTALGTSGLDCTKPLPGTLVTWSGTTPGQTVADGFLRWGIDSSIPHDQIEALYEVKIATVNKISDATGAFDPSPTGAKPEVLTVLVAVGPTANMPLCTGALAPLAGLVRCAPLVVFQHGITVAKNLMLGAANTLVAAGNVVVAIDLPWHGERTYCSVDQECVPGAHCVAEPSMAAQAIGGGASPGKCRAGTLPTDPPAPFLNQAGICLGTDCVCAGGACVFPQNQGYPFGSGDFFISANFFRTRDGMRQAWIDHTQLMQVVAPSPSPTGAIAGHDLYNALLARGAVVDPTRVSFLGMSLGAMVTTGSMAANPRVTHAVLNANGGTAVDTFLNSPNYQAQVDALFLTLGIDRSVLRNPPPVGDPAYPAYLAQASAYLTYLNVLKLIIDPADPINAGGHLSSDTWPNLVPPLGGALDGSVAQARKEALGQYAVCDQSVPNPFNALVSGVAGLTPATPPLPPATPPVSGTAQWFATTAVTAPASAVYPDGCPLGAPHGFLVSWGAEFPAGTPGRAAVAAITQAAQDGAASFLTDPVPLSPTLFFVP